MTHRLSHEHTPPVRDVYWQLHVKTYLGVYVLKIRAHRDHSNTRNSGCKYLR